MSLCREQIDFKIGKVKTKWWKKQRNKYIRRQAKKIENEHPKSNRYKGWIF